MEITINKIEIKVEKKKIKNLHIYVQPPYGNVLITAPEAMTVKAIENFARINYGWIKDKQEKMLAQPRKTVRKYISGETYFIWGKQYFLEVNNSKKRYFKLDGNKILLGINSTSSIENTRKYFNNELRKILYKQLDRLFPILQNKINLFCNTYRIRYMKTKWGTCNPQKKTIWINLQLVEKPLDCLEYIILHELVHLKVNNHGKDFIALMDAYMPNWKIIKQKLNSYAIDSINPKIA